jgi:NAD-dependent DNA ligase
LQATELEGAMNRLVEPVKIAERAESNLLEEIKASKSQTLARLIFALGIRFVGERTGQLLAEQFSSLEELADAKEDQLVAVPEVGPKVASAIAEFFSERANLGLIKRLRKAEVHPTTEKRQFKSAKFAGKTFVFTGGLANRTREEAGELVQEHGGVISGSVSKNIDYVVVGTDPGSKYDKAKELGIATLTESEFEELLATPQKAIQEAGGLERKQKTTVGVQKKTKDLGSDKNPLKGKKTAIRKSPTKNAAEETRKRAAKKPRGKQLQLF